FQGISIATVIATKWHARYITQSDTGATTVMLVTGSSNSTQRNAVKAVGEGNNTATTGHFTRNFQCGFNSVSTGRPGKLHAVIHSARRGNMFSERLQKFCFGIGVHVQTVGNTVFFNVI